MGLEVLQLWAGQEGQGHGHNQTRWSFKGRELLNQKKSISTKPYEKA